MRALVVFTDGRTLRYGGIPAADDRLDAREALRECSPDHTVEPVRIELPGMPWSVYAADAALNPDDPRWMRNIPASILPSQYHADMVALFGPVVLTPGGPEPTAPAWDVLDGFVDDIVRAIHGLPMSTRPATWRSTVALAAAVVDATPRGAKVGARFGG